MTLDRSKPTLDYTSPSVPRISWDRLRSIFRVTAWIAFAGAIACAVLMLWAARLPVSNGLLSIAGLLIGLTSAGLWVASAAIEITVVRWRGQPARRQATALLILTPVIFAATGALLASDLPCRLMFYANKPAMDRWAQALLTSPGTPSNARVGSYEAYDIELIPGGVEFLVVGCGFFRYGGGFAYSPSGPPPGSTNESFTPIGGAWYVRTYDGQ
jgi:hypothetical protein